MDPIPPTMLPRPMKSLVSMVSSTNDIENEQDAFRYIQDDHHVPMDDDVRTMNNHSEPDSFAGPTGTHGDDGYVLDKGRKVSESASHMENNDGGSNAGHYSPDVDEDDVSMSENALSASNIAEIQAPQAPIDHMVTVGDMSGYDSG